MLKLRPLFLLVTVGLLIPVQCLCLNTPLHCLGPEKAKQLLQELPRNRMKLIVINALYPSNVLIASHIKIEFVSGALLDSKYAIYKSFHQAHLDIQRRVVQYHHNGIMSIHTNNALLRWVLKQTLSYKDEDLIERVRNPKVDYFPKEVLDFLPVFFTGKLSSFQFVSIAKFVEHHFFLERPNDAAFMLKIMRICGSAQPQLPFFIQHYKRFLALLDYLFEDSVSHISPKKVLTLRDVWAWFGHQHEYLVDQMEPLDGSPIATRRALLAAQACALHLLFDCMITDPSGHLKSVSEKFIKKLLPANFNIIKELLTVIS